MIKVMLVDDHSIVRAGLRRIIEETEDIEVITEASNGREAIRLAHQHPPDIAIIDISMPDLDGLEVTGRLLTDYPHLPILILTMYEEAQYAIKAIEIGAKGYITKKSAPEQLVAAIRKVFDGQLYITEQVAEVLALRVAKKSQNRSSLDTLSTRELQVLRRLALGHTNREIAEAYCISVKTVDTYRYRLLKKLNLRNNAELVRFATKNKLVEL